MSGGGCRENNWEFNGKSHDWAYVKLFYSVVIGRLLNVALKKILTLCVFSFSEAETTSITPVKASLCRTTLRTVCTPRPCSAKDIVFWYAYCHKLIVARRDRIVVSTLRCGRSNPGSNPGHGIVSQCHGRWVVLLCSYRWLMCVEINVIIS